MIDETRRAGGLLGRVGFVARLSACLAMAAVKAQGSIALFENPKPPQGAGFFGQVEVAAMLGDDDTAATEKFGGTKKF